LLSAHADANPLGWRYLILNENNCAAIGIAEGALVLNTEIAFGRHSVRVAPTPSSRILEGGGSLLCGGDPLSLMAGTEPTMARVTAASPGKAPVAFVSIIGFACGTLADLTRLSTALILLAVFYMLNAAYGWSSCNPA
jgi:hypothetical protein